MAKQPPASQLDLQKLAQPLQVLGRDGICSTTSAVVRDLLVGLHLVRPADDRKRLVATSRLLALGPTREEGHAVRRVLSLQLAYRQHLLTLLLGAIRQLADDRALAETLERLDHLSPELHGLVENPESTPEGEGEFGRWNAEVWQAPDAITLLSKVVERPADIPEWPVGTPIPVGFDWLSWQTPPERPAPAPWGDPTLLDDPLATAQHPFWGALVATLDACTGDYPWQSLVIRGGILRSRHRRFGDAEAVLKELWDRELGLYPVAPLVLPEDVPWTVGEPVAWLQRGLDRMAEAGIAVQAEGSWRLTSEFRKELMKDDEHMLAFEAIRQRSYRLARAAEQMAEPSQEAVSV